MRHRRRRRRRQLQRHRTRRLQRLSRLDMHTLWRNERETQVIFLKINFLSLMFDILLSNSVHTDPLLEIEIFIQISFCIVNLSRYVVCSDLF